MVKAEDLVLLRGRLVVGGPLCVRFSKRADWTPGATPVPLRLWGIGDGSCGLNGEVSLAIARCRDFFFYLGHGVVFKFWEFVVLVPLIWEELVKGHGMVLDGTYW